MPKPLTEEQKNLLEDVYYDKGVMMGRDRLFKYFQENHAESMITRRHIFAFLENQEINQLHRRAKSERDIKSTIYSKRGHIAVDLKDNQNIEIDGYNYMFNAVDMATRKVYSVAMKNKTDTTSLNAFKEIVKQVGDVKSIRSDRGSEFINTKMKKYLKSKNINQILSSAKNPQSNGMIERQNSTFARLISKSIMHDKDFNWVKSLGKILNAINSTPNKELGISPNEMEKLYSDKKTAEIQNLYEKQKNAKSKQHKLATAEFEEGDMVRIYNFTPDQKFKLRNWSRETYTIQKVYKPKVDCGIYEYKLEGVDNRYKGNEQLKIPAIENPVDDADDEDVYELSSIVKALISKVNAI